MLILLCSFIQDDSLVQSICYVQSQNHIYYVGDTMGIVSPQYPDSLDNAGKALDMVHRKGGKAVIGLMGIPEDMAEEYNLKPTDLFDPCTNIHIGTSILSASISAMESSQKTQKNSKEYRKKIIKDFAKKCGITDTVFVDIVLINIDFFDRTNDVSNRNFSRKNFKSDGLDLGSNSDIFLKNSLDQSGLTLKELGAP
jgi:hypothetical protein